MAKLAVACTDQRLYPRAVSSFYFIHKAIADAVKQHEKHSGAPRSPKEPHHGSFCQYLGQIYGMAAVCYKWCGMAFAEVGQIAGICSRVDRTAAFEDDLRTLLGCVHVHLAIAALLCMHKIAAIVTTLSASPCPAAASPEGVVGKGHPPSNCMMQGQLARACEPAVASSKHVPGAHRRNS